MTRVSSSLTRNRGGAEIECTLLFADVRGSTALGEDLSPGEFKRLLNRFYEAASAVVFEHDGVVDKFVGDELVALFFPLFAGPDHAKSALEAAQALLAATGHADPAGAWLPVGVGVHSGIAWVGSVGGDAHREFTALGDAVNTAARLSSHAGPGEILVTVGTATDAGLESYATRQLHLKGKAGATEVVTVTLRSPNVPQQGR